MVQPLPFNSFTPRVSYGHIKVILTSESVDEILCCDHLMKPCQQYFHMVLFICFLCIQANLSKIISIRRRNGELDKTK